MRSSDAPSEAGVIDRLKDRLALGLSAVCAKPVDWLGVVYTWLVHKSKRTKVNFLELVLLGLSVPCFHARYFLFKFTYTIRHRQMVRLCSRSGHSGHPHYCEQFGELGLDGLTLPEAKERLRCIADRIQETGELIQAGNVVHRERILQLETELAALRGCRQDGPRVNSNTDEYRRLAVAAEKAAQEANERVLAEKSE